jgi:hypothetical protein
MRSDIDGLIMDLRFNAGGDFVNFDYFNVIFRQSFGEYDMSVRTAGGGHMELEGVGYDWMPEFDSVFYLDKPIALLVGPGAGSAGDYLSYIINMQPTSRSFGKPSNAGFTHFLNCMNTPDDFVDTCLWWNLGFPGWFFTMAPRNFTLYHEGVPVYLLHKGFEVDEEIWFTQEAAKLQVDNMVERAIEWIDSVASASVYISEKSPPFEFTIYPNPVIDVLNVEASYSGVKELIITNPSGKSLYSELFGRTTHQINISSFEKGIYVITIRSKDFVTTRKIVKL